MGCSREEPWRGQGQGCDADRGQIHLHPTNPGRAWNPAVSQRLPGHGLLGEAGVASEALKGAGSQNLSEEPSRSLQAACSPRPYAAHGHIQRHGSRAHRHTHTRTHSHTVSHTSGCSSTVSYPDVQSPSYRASRYTPQTHSHRGLFPGRPLPMNVTQAWEGWEVSSDVFIAIVWDRKLPL